MAQRLCSALVDPVGLRALLACRLITQDKNPGIYPIGICEVMRCIIAKAVLTVTRSDIMEAVGPLQLCAGQSAGLEATSHAVRSWFEDDNTEVILLIDASNAFNVLNRHSSLLNVCHLCPSFATVLINCYREAAALFVDRSVLWSEDGTTQGDPLCHAVLCSSHHPPHLDSCHS